MMADGTRRGAAWIMRRRCRRWPICLPWTWRGRPRVALERARDCREDRTTNPRCCGSKSPCSVGRDVHEGSETDMSEPAHAMMDLVTLLRRRRTTSHRDPRLQRVGGRAIRDAGAPPLVHRPGRVRRGIWSSFSLVMPMGQRRNWRAKRAKQVAGPHLCETRLVGSGRTVTWLRRRYGVPSARYVDDIYVFVESVDAVEQLLRKLIRHSVLMTCA